VLSGPGGESIILTDQFARKKELKFDVSLLPGTYALRKCGWPRFNRSQGPRDSDHRAIARQAAAAAKSQLMSYCCCQPTLHAVSGVFAVCAGLAADTGSGWVPAGAVTWCRTRDVVLVLELAGLLGFREGGGGCGYPGAVHHRGADRVAAGGTACAVRAGCGMGSGAGLARETDLGIGALSVWVLCGGAGAGWIPVYVLPGEGVILGTHPDNYDALTYPSSHAWVLVAVRVVLPVADAEVRGRRPFPMNRLGVCWWR